MLGWSGSDETIAKPVHLAPRDIRSRSPQSLGQPPGGFAEHLHLMDQSVLQDPISAELVLTDPRHELLVLIERLCHVLGQGLVRRRHRRGPWFPPKPNPAGAGSGPAPSRDPRRARRTAPASPRHPGVRRGSSESWNRRLDRYPSPRTPLTEPQIRTREGAGSCGRDTRSPTRIRQTGPYLKVSHTK